jgi:hypothetical protein
LVWLMSPPWECVLELTQVNERLGPTTPAWYTSQDAQTTADHPYNSSIQHFKLSEYVADASALVDEVF